jgi:protoporphyrinogen oxidase
MKNKKVLVIGAGFAGLAAALELSKKGIEVFIVEKSSAAGGLSQTINLDGVKFELGPHIYFDKDVEVVRFWKELVGENMKSYLRNNRIFYQGKYIHSPLNPWDTLVKLGIPKVISLVSSFIFAKLKKHKIHSAEDWVKANFGKALFDNFFKVYNEKIWGLSCSEISPNWAGQRIKSSLTTMVIKSLKKDKDFIVKTFNFPYGGSESIYQAQVDRLQQADNVKIKFNCFPTKIKTKDQGFEISLSSGEKNLEFSDIVSTIHLDDLCDVLDSNQIDQSKLKEALSKLLYRHLVLVNLIFPKSSVKNFKEHWIDIHDPSVLALRVTNFGNYEFGLNGVDKSGVGLEYNCFESDAIWEMSDKEILSLALADLVKMRLIDKSLQPSNFSVLKIPKSYPVYFRGYEQYTEIIFGELKKIEGLHLAGRNSMYKWNNMHHSVKTGLLAARNILGEQHDLFEVKGMVSIGKESD